MEEYTIYIDTDSLFLNLQKFLEEQGLFEKFKSLDKEKQIYFIRKIAGSIQNYVNEKSFERTQCIDFNSQERDHKLTFKSEKVNESGLWVSKKRYCIWCLEDNGVKPKENLQVTGLETVKSSTPTVVKPMITDVMVKLLTLENKEDVLQVIEKYREELKQARPEEIAENLAVHDINKYIAPTGGPIKGTPRHTKGVLFYRMLCKHLDVENKAEKIENDEKVKCVYVKPNPLGIQSLSFITWLEEFDTLLSLDYDKMIEKLFISKIKQLIESAGITFVDTKVNLNPLSNWFD